jgi:tetratricopeptide (TPR) repeat protein
MNLESSNSLKSQGNDAFKTGQIEKALEFYNQALTELEHIKTSYISQIRSKEHNDTHYYESFIALHNNIALCYYKKGSYLKTIQISSICLNNLGMNTYAYVLYVVCMHFII